MTPGGSDVAVATAVFATGSPPFRGVGGLPQIAFSTPSPSHLSPAAASGLWMGRQAADITCPPRAKESTRISFPLKTTTTFIRPGSTSPQNVREANIPASPTDTAPSPALGFRLMISKRVPWKYMVPMLGHQGPRQRPGVLCCQSTCRGGFVSGMQDTGISSLPSLHVDPELAL